MDDEIEVPQKAGYVQISRVLLDKRSAEPRDDIHNVLFELGLFSNMKLEEWLTLEEIQSTVAREIGIEYYPVEPLKRAIPRLVDEGRIRTKREGSLDLFSLANDRRARFREYAEETGELYQSIVGELARGIEKEVGELSSENHDLICEVLDRTLSSIFAAAQSVSTRVFVEGGEESEPPPPDVPREFTRHLQCIKKPSIRRSVSKNIREMLHSPSRELKRYFLLCANTSFILRLLNLDPECQNLQRSIFSRISMFLDTNIVISALFSADEMHDMTREVLKESSQLGVRLHITSQTLMEIGKVIDRADDLFSRAKRPSMSKFHIPENVIVETFVRDREAKGDAWETFLLSIRKHQEIMESKYNVTLDETDYEENIGDDKLSELQRVVKDCSQVRLYPKSNDVAEHDAYHFLVVDYLRENADSANTIWFLSHDRTFDCVNRAYFELEKKSLPCSILCSSWMEALFPFLSPDISEERLEDLFLGVMASDFFSMTRGLSFGNLTRFFMPFFEDEHLDEEDYLAILQDQVLNRILDDWKESAYSSEFDQQIAETVAELVDRRKDIKLRELGSELRSRNGDVDGLSKKLLALEKASLSSDRDQKREASALRNEVTALTAQVQAKRRRETNYTRATELAIASLSAILTVILWTIVDPTDALSILGVLGGGALIGGFFIGLVRWIIRD